MFNLLIIKYKSMLRKYQNEKTSEEEALKIIQQIYIKDEIIKRQF